MAGSDHLPPVLLFVNPFGVARVVNAGYTIHPDHKGAAEFMKSLRLAPNDIVVAEDVIEQTYYLGHVDYWLIGRGVDKDFVEDWHGKILDIYTHTPVIDSGADLEELIAMPRRGAIYVIGSGENQADDRRHMRGLDIYELLKSGAFKRIYLGAGRAHGNFESRCASGQTRARIRRSSNGTLMTGIAKQAVVVSLSRFANYGLVLVSPIVLVRLLTVGEFGRYREFLVYSSVLAQSQHSAYLPVCYISCRKVRRVLGNIYARPFNLQRSRALL